MKDGTEDTSGRGQIISNINACQAVVDVVKTTLGKLFSTPKQSEPSGWETDSTFTKNPLAAEKRYERGRHSLCLNFGATKTSI